MVKFIHAADLHMDRSFEGLPNINPAIREKLLNANLSIMEKIVSAAINNQVDFLLLAGDTFHQNTPTLKTQQHFFEQLKRLEELAIPVFLIFGNHDYYHPDRYWFEFPKNVSLFKEEQITTMNLTTSDGETVAISGFSYQHPWITENKVGEFPKRYDVDYHIGMYHGEMGNNNYAPFRLSEMNEKGYDYWALGHIHVPTVLGENPYIVYSGAPQGHTQKEKSANTVYLVELKETEQSCQPIQIAEVRWQTQTINLEKAKGTSDLFESIRNQIDRSVKQTILLHLDFAMYDHLPLEVIQQLKNDEFLSYLLDEINRWDKKFIVWRITFKKEKIKEKIDMRASKQLIEEMLNAYEDPIIFQQILHEIYTHPEGIRILNEFKDYIPEVIEQTKLVLSNDFSFGGE